MVRLFYHISILITNLFPIIKKLKVNYEITY